jgi:hypothetical protein
MLVASGKLTIEQVKSNDLYPKLIRGEELTHDEMKGRMYKMKLANKKKYSKELKLDFAPYAFAKCYKSKHRKNSTRKKRSTKKNKK